MEPSCEPVRYMPKGTGSYHWLVEIGGSRRFVTVDDLDTKPWIASQRETTFAGLTVAYETARTLQDDLGLSMVVGPIKSRELSVVARLSAQQSMAVFPFVEGTYGQWGDQLPGHRRTELLRELAKLHGATTNLRAPMAAALSTCRTTRARFRARQPRPTLAGGGPSPNTARRVKGPYGLPLVRDDAGRAVPASC